MAMSKRDYEGIARVINDTLVWMEGDASPIADDERLMAAGRLTLIVMIGRMCNHFHEMNENFSSLKFFDACGLGEGAEGNGH